MLPLFEEILVHLLSALIIPSASQTGPQLNSPSGELPTLLAQGLQALEPEAALGAQRHTLLLNTSDLCSNSAHILGCGSAIHGKASLLFTPLRQALLRCGQTCYKGIELAELLRLLQKLSAVLFLCCSQALLLFCKQVASGSHNCREHSLEFRLCGLLFCLDLLLLLVLHLREGLQLFFQLSDDALRICALLPQQSTLRLQLLPRLSRTVELILCS
mmetsp:Transcript_20830/g.48282  ORF Transcript_20830/g.48282 Transcript_20830/m.48282 type:complete len:216 (+) Transcript_20830:589-1236(+)